MDLSDFVAPRPNPIVGVTPSLANQLLACELRVAFSRDPQNGRWNRPSTYSVLGTAAHAVSEAVFRRRSWPSEPALLRTALEEVWETEIEKGSAKLATAWAPAEPPAAYEWPGYSLTKTRTIRRAVKLLQGSPEVPIRPQPERWSVEVQLKDPNSELFGRADRIEQIGDSVRVLDLKTGLRQGEPTDDQRRQLLMYAVLIHRTTGKWPHSVAVEDATGCRHEMALAPSDAEEELARVESMVAKFNSRKSPGEFFDGATPSPERCRWCSYRPLCGPFWRELTTEWGQQAAFGSIKERGWTDSGGYVRLEVESPRDRSEREILIGGLSGQIAETSTHVAAVDWRGGIDARSVRARWMTLVREW